MGCLDNIGAGDCYERRRLADIEGNVTALVASRDRVFFVEDGARIRGVLDEVLLPEPSLAIDKGRITSLALPADFETSRMVFVAWTENARNGMEIFNLTRYREVNGLLGEGATIVAGLQVPTGATPVIAIDLDGLVYVALPAAADGGSILRFDADGRVPAGNPNGSPIVAHGYANPSSLVFDRATHQLWLAGSDALWPDPVSTLPVDLRGAEWPWRPSVVPTGDVRLANPARLAVTRDIASRYVWWIRNDGVLERVAASATRGAQLSGSAQIGSIDKVMVIGQGLSQDLLLVTQEGTGSTVWRLVPGASSR
jgi:hypothetical protein